ncbi:MAG: LPS export ABC transporter permease LptF [Gammaproteobacteria bacterium]
MIITRYLSKEVMNALIAITLILLLAFLSQQVVRYLNYVAIGKIPTGILLQLVSFEIPYLLAFLLPLGLYLGILLAYGRLYSDNEMAILQMSGFGRRRLMRLTVMIGAVVSLIVLLLMTWVNPLISAKRQVMMASDEATLHLVETLIPGRFQTSPDGRHVMYVEKLSRNHERAENVFMAQELKQAAATTEDGGPVQPAWMLVSAKEGYQEKDPASSDQFFVTRDGYRYEGTPGQNDYKIVQFKKYAVRILQGDPRVTHQEVETLSTLKLWQEYAKPKEAAEFQWRFSVAFSAILLALLAVPLSRVRPRQGRFLALLPAILIYIFYINLLFVARHWVEQGDISIAVGMWWVHGLMLAVVGLILLFNARQWSA